MYPYIFSRTAKGRLKNRDSFAGVGRTDLDVTIDERTPGPLKDFRALRFSWLSKAGVFLALSDGKGYAFLRGLALLILSAALAEWDIGASKVKPPQPIFFVTEQWTLLVDIR
jgi:hypothetical protein